MCARYKYEVRKFFVVGQLHFLKIIVAPNNKSILKLHRWQITESGEFRP